MLYSYGKQSDKRFLSSTIEGFKLLLGDLEFLEDTAQAVQQWVGSV